MKDYMKKIISFFTALILVFSLVGCEYSEVITIINEIAELAEIMDEPSIMPDIIDAGFAVHYIDVGQADSALVMCDDKAMLIDGGNSDDSNLIVAYLKRYGIDYLDYIVCSHAHEDHVGGLSGALSAVEVGAVYSPEEETDTKSYKNFKKKVKEQGLKIEHPMPGDSFNLGSSVVEIFAPIYKAEDELNNSSIVLKITYGDNSFLFTGDAESIEEKDILDEGYDVSADVLKVGHHGSNSSTIYSFLREVMPEYAVISVGKGNDYGHPSKEVLSRLKDAGAEIYRTDKSGDIIVTSDGRDLRVITSR